MKTTAITIMGCRSAREELTPGSHTKPEYKCVLCSEQLQMTAQGLEKYEKDSAIKLFCTPCAIWFANEAKKKGNLAGMELHEKALAALEHVDTKQADWVREELKERWGKA